MGNSAQSRSTRKWQHATAHQDCSAAALAGQGTVCWARPHVPRRWNVLDPVLAPVHGGPHCTLLSHQAHLACAHGARLYVRRALVVSLWQWVRAGDDSPSNSDECRHPSRPTLQWCIPSPQATLLNDEAVDNLNGKSESRNVKSALVSLKS